MALHGLEIRGFSLGGVETCVMLPEWSLAIDVGRAPRALLAHNHIALTHTHMDHAGGLPYYLALRQLFSMAPPTLYAPAQVAERLRAMLSAWDALQGFRSRYELVEVEAGGRYALRRGLELVPFRTYHGVPSFGYTVVETRHKLKPEMAGRSGPELASLKREGVEITQETRIPRLSVTGDTVVEVLDRQPQILESEVLVLECTFLDAQKSLEHSRAGAHVHLTELLPYLPRVANRALVLSHFSQIYRTADIDRLLAPLAEEVRNELWAMPTVEGEALRPIPKPA